MKLPGGSMYLDMAPKRANQRKIKIKITENKNKKTTKSRDKRLVFFLHLTSLRSSERSKNGQKAQRNATKNTSSSTPGLVKSSVFIHLTSLRFSERRKG
jgi:hypothetical protein